MSTSEFPFDDKIARPVSGVTNSGRTVNEVSTNQAYRFAGFTLDPARAALLRDGEEIPLRQRTFEVLTHLAIPAGWCRSRSSSRRCGGTSP
jgi:DNA-binding response OmpR family regulator